MDNTLLRPLSDELQRQENARKERDEFVAALQVVVRLWPKYSTGGVRVIQDKVAKQPTKEAPKTVVGHMTQYLVEAPDHHLDCGTVADALVRDEMYEKRSVAMKAARSIFSSRKDLFKWAHPGRYQLTEAAIHRVTFGGKEAGAGKPRKGKTRAGVMARRRRGFIEYAKQHDGELVITEAMTPMITGGLFETKAQYRNQSYKIVGGMKKEFAPVVPGKFRLIEARQESLRLMPVPNGHNSVEESPTLSGLEKPRSLNGTGS